MKYSLHRCEVLYNRAMCKQIVGNFDKAEVDIVDAQKYVETENQRNIIGTAARMGVVVS